MCFGQGDQMFLLKNRPKTMKSRPTMFLLNHWAIFSRKKLPNAIKNRPNGEISPNLVTLVLGHESFNFEIDKNILGINMNNAIAYS